jgi:tRNA U34 5-methylaminomethyl-2-thiouridine-forming methyltransferase MnmC
MSINKNMLKAWLREKFNERAIFYDVDPMKYGFSSVRAIPASKDEIEKLVEEIAKEIDE